MTRNAGVVAAGHPQTVAAAAAMLDAGGNAYDAILAGFWAACVVEPALSSPAGGGFLLARPASAPATLYDFFVQTPRSKRRADELDFYGISADFGGVTQCFHIGLGAMATPGCVRGVFEVHRDLCGMPMREIVAPAVELARNGVELNSFQAYILDIIRPIFLATDSSRAVFQSEILPDRAKQAGERLQMDAFADLLTELAREGDRFFYEGDLAQTIASMSQSGGGHLAIEDLQGYRVHKRTPLVTRLGQMTLMTNPPPSSGGPLIAFGLQCLGSLRNTQFGSIEHLSLLISAMAATEQARLTANASGTPLDGLLDQDLLATYRAQVTGRAACFRGTTHISVVDSAGNLASMTTSNGEGCGHMVPGGGFMLNNMLGEEDINPGGFHRWTSNQRMTSMMAPTILIDDHHSIALGSGGSNRIRTAILQVLVNIEAFGMSLSESVNAPRVHMERGKLDMEPGFSDRVVQQVGAQVDNLVVWKDRNLYFGGAHTVSRSAEGMQGVGDPRRGGASRIV